MDKNVLDEYNFVLENIHNKANLFFIGFLINKNS